MRGLLAQHCREIRRRFREHCLVPEHMQLELDRQDGNPCLCHADIGQHSERPTCIYQQVTGVSSFLGHDEKRS